MPRRIGGIFSRTENLKNQDERIKMKFKVIIMVGVALVMSACTSEDEADKQAVNLDSEVKKFSYAMGMDVGRSLKGLDAGVDSAAFALAVSHVLQDEYTLLDQKESAEIKQAFFKQKQEAKMDEQKAKGAKNSAAGEAFLAENAQKEGVKVTDSGLQYEVLVQGDGEKPQATDTVKVHYKGTLLDGTEFDSSYSRGQPISFPLNGVIKGWTEGVALMAVGSKYKLYVPAALAYGERGAGAKIGPNSTLIFEVELLAIEK
ncbi:MAG: FKBP-type peptidyl-prolyl cis-trans isomerase [Mariprofundaceae bacterium]|nr:FKBP-type peptidyl-prolyl cis-trans isomerase [Mariprofundaceae bacterium]